ncbi:hypothetical protein V1503_19570 [Bacillus sp. SCS-151]|uniref:hypothetical protein n=1 Tax=Nanhaiella sioensis TaxID=3115293 RepID=UPI00397C3678
MQYAHKSYLVEVEQLTSDGEIETITGTQYGNNGDYLLTAGDGHRRIENKAYFEKMYVPVQKKRIVNLDEMAKNYNQEWVTGNEDYIFETKKLVSDKPC